jgi:hypothetical protein
MRLDGQSHFVCCVAVGAGSVRAEDLNSGGELVVIGW